MQYCNKFNKDFKDDPHPHQKKNLLKKHFKEKNRYTSYIPFAPKSHGIFAFEWQDPKTQQKQYFQTVLL